MIAFVAFDLWCTLGQNAIKWEAAGMRMGTSKYEAGYSARSLEESVEAVLTSHYDDFWTPSSGDMSN